MYLSFGTLQIQVQIHEGQTPPGPNRAMFFNVVCMLHNIFLTLYQAHRAGCSITRYSSNHSFNPLVSSKSEHNLSSQVERNSQCSFVKPSIITFLCNTANFIKYTCNRSKLFLLKCLTRYAVLCWLLTFDNTLWMAKYWNFLEKDQNSIWLLM